jgi:two-component system cell cycle response regulator
MARILIIEDNVANLKLMSYLLRMFGHTPLEAPDGQSGLEQAAELPDLILCDIQLPDMSGAEVARYLRSHPRYRQIPLIAVTAFAMVGDEERILSAGFDGYLSKPINPEFFVGQVEGFLQPTLPSGSAETAEPKAANATEAHFSHPVTEVNGKTVLVVDNMAVHRELARSILEPFGYRVVEAGGVAEGLAKARETPCNLIISDICMPESSGYDFLTALAADPLLRSIPVILITSTRVSEADHARALALGASRYLVRPLEPEVFLTEVRALIP